MHQNKRLQFYLAMLAISLIIKNTIKTKSDTFSVKLSKQRHGNRIKISHPLYTIRTSLHCLVAHVKGGETWAERLLISSLGVWGVSLIILTCNSCGIWLLVNEWNSWHCSSEEFFNWLYCCLHWSNSWLVCCFWSGSIFQLHIYKYNYPRQCAEM